MSDQEYQLIRKGGAPVKLDKIEVEGQKVTMPLATFLKLLNHANEIQEKLDQITDVLCPQTEVEKAKEPEKKAPLSASTTYVGPWGIFPAMFAGED